MTASPSTFSATSRALPIATWQEATHSESGRWCGLWKLTSCCPSDAASPTLNPETIYTSDDLTGLDNLSIKFSGGVFRGEDRSGYWHVEKLVTCLILPTFVSGVLLAIDWTSLWYGCPLRIVRCGTVGGSTSDTSTFRPGRSYDGLTERVGSRLVPARDPIVPVTFAWGCYWDLLEEAGYDAPSDVVGAENPVVVGEGCDGGWGIRITDNLSQYMVRNANAPGADTMPAIRCILTSLGTCPPDQYCTVPATASFSDSDPSEVIMCTATFSVS